MRGLLHGATASGLAMLLMATAVPVGAASDPGGDALDSEPDHDILQVAFEERGDEVRFTVTVDGKVRTPEVSLEDFRFEFRVVPGSLYQPGLSPQAAGARHTVGLSTQGEYGVFRTGGFGYTLPEQPASGQSGATWKLPKAYLDATAAARPLAGDYLADIKVSARRLALSQDDASHPDVKLELDSDPGTKLHLREGGVLRPGAPDDDVPATATIWKDQTLVAEWASEALGGPLKLDDLSAVLWITTTTSTPVLSDEDFVVDLYDESSDGSRERVARRSESVSPQPGANTNLFIAPGAPQRMPFQLLAENGAQNIPTNHKAVLRVAVDGFFSNESGPMLIYHDSKDLDSFFLAGKQPVPRPDRSACPSENNVTELPRAAC